MQKSLIPGHNNSRHLSSEELENNIGGLPVTENRIQEIFDALDVEHSGTVSIDVVKDFYTSLEHYGLELTEKEVDALVRKYANTKDDSLTYDEFACFILNLTQW
ncbi:unnamed protein product [Phytomonas sp. Hart1]|nr:unnamed protein product [Phytomonas sp. Hart1]|eukprot:CCW69266.1 unnamed protein product [Phytomonas sp. isolate Hart1]